MLARIYVINFQNALNQPSFELQKFYLSKILPKIEWYSHQWPQDGKMRYVTAVLVKIHFLTDCSSC